MSIDPNPNATPPRRWLALAVLLSGTLLPPLDFFIVNVTLPNIRTDLQASADVAQLVVSIYAMAYAVTLILGGRLGDLYGRRRTFVAGMFGFALASALCGFAASPNVLVVGRLLQGISAAVMAPQSLASIHALFPPGEKGRALGLYGVTFGLASVGGQLLGGWLVSVDLWEMGWRSVFLINLPVIALAIPAALIWVRETRAEEAGGMDFGGAILLALGLLALVVPVIEGREHGWPWWSLGLLTLSPALLALFWRYEAQRERSGAPALMPLSVISATRGLPLGLLAAVLLYALAAFFLTFAVYQQAGLGRDALAAGLAILPLGIGQLLGPTCGIRLSRWLGSSAATFGMSLEALGLVLVASAAASGRPSWLPLPLLVVGVGQGIALPALVRLNVDLVEPRWAGLAAGMVSAAMQLGAALSVALVGGVFFSLAPDGAGVEEVASGFAAACLMIASAMAVAAVLSRRLAVTTTMVRRALRAGREVVSKPEIYCMSSGIDGKDGCHCYSEQGTKRSVPVEICRSVARDGVYNPYRDPLPVAAAAPGQPEPASASSSGTGASVSRSDRSLGTFPENTPYATETYTPPTSLKM